VIAVNQYGDSAYSAVGSGAVIYLVPDAPINLLNNAAVTDETEIGIIWTAGALDGDTPVIDYRLWYNLESEFTFIILKAGLTSTSHTTDFTILAGENYKFKVQARNLVGYGSLSDEIIIRAAEVPESPTNVLTTIDFN
jgi:hypothetical protein